MTTTTNTKRTTISECGNVRGAAPHSAGHASPTSRGFTLIELITTLFIAAILMTIAMPNLAMFLENNRVKQAVGDLAADLNFARSEASKRRFPVTVCARASGNVCANSASWNNGWLVFADDDGNGAVDGNNEILRVVDKLPDNVTVETSGFATPAYAQYSASGESNVSGRFKICDSRTGYENIARAIDIAATGRANVDPQKYACSAL